MGHARMHSVTVAVGTFGMLSLACAARADVAVVRDVLIQRDSATTRIVVRIDGPVHYRSHGSEDGKAILVDLVDASLDPEVPRLLPVSDPRVDGVLMQSDPVSHVVRVCVDYAGRVAPVLDANVDGSRLLLDFRAPGPGGSPPFGAKPRSIREARRTADTSTRQPKENLDAEPSEVQVAKERARAKIEAPEPISEATRSPAAQRAASSSPVAHEASSSTPTVRRRSVLERPVVVLDPGHGGKDPGARAWTGEVEKDIVLDLAQRVARRLRAGGDVEVVMTRSGDEFIELADRRETSRRWDADVFVSIHANASHNTAARGIETYYHSRSVADRGMRRLIRAENAGAAGSGLSSALRLKASASMSRTSLSSSSAPVLDRRSESIRLAKDVQEELVRQLGMRYEAVRDLGAKEGPFFVIGENAAPSVLVEAAFLTHREESLRMRSEVYREQIADGVARGILLFLEQQRSIGTL